MIKITRKKVNEYFETTLEIIIDVAVILLILYWIYNYVITGGKLT